MDNMNPSNPERTYAGKGWVSWKDWLGTDYLAFDAARCLSEPFRKFVTDFLLKTLDMDKSDIVTFMTGSVAVRCESEPFRKFVTEFLIGKLDLTNQGELVKFMTWRYSLRFRGFSKVHQRLSQPRWPA